MSVSRRTVLVVTVAVLGIALAAAITWGTSQLVRQRIGLASEPLTAGRGLLPPAARAPASSPSTTSTSTTSTSRRTPAPSRTTSTSLEAPTTTAGSAPVQSIEPARPAEPAKPVTTRSGAEGDASSRRDD